MIAYTERQAVADLLNWNRDQQKKLVDQHFELLDRLRYLDEIDRSSKMQELQTLDKTLGEKTDTVYQLQKTLVDSLDSFNEAITTGNTMLEKLNAAMKMVSLPEVNEVGQKDNDTAEFDLDENKIIGEPVSLAQLQDAMVDVQSRTQMPLNEFEKAMNSKEDDTKVFQSKKEKVTKITKFAKGMSADIEEPLPPYMKIHHSTNRLVNDYEAQAKLVAEYLMEHPMSPLSNINQYIEALGIRWSGTGSAAMNNLMDIDPNIKRPSKGHYTYVPSSRSRVSDMSMQQIQ
jgi:hypothetical protein